MIFIIMQVLLLILLILFGFYKKINTKEKWILLSVSEFITIVYTFVYFRLASDMYLLLTGVVAILSVYIAYVDIKTRIISTKLNMMVLIVAMIFMFIRDDIAFYNPILTGVVAFAVAKIMCRLSKQQIGEGDVKLIVVYSVAYGFPKIMQVLFYALILCLVVGTVLMLVKRKNMKMELPFAPFLLSGSILFDILSHLG